MKNKIDLSIIVPVYNAEKFVLKAYNELLDQKLANFEIIFVDNNSTDTTVPLIHDLVENDKRIILLFESNQGAAAARNKGIKHAQGSFLYFFDVDDELYENSIIKLLQVLKNNAEVDTVFGKRTRTKEINQLHKEDKIEGVYNKKPYWGLYWFNQFSTLAGPPAFLHRAEVIDKIGTFPEELLIGEDAAFHIKIGMFCNVIFVDQNIYNYNRHEASSVSINNAKTAKLNTYWKQFIDFYIPFNKRYHNETPKIFKEILNRHLSFSFGRFLLSVKTYQERFSKYEFCRNQLSNHKLPILTNVIMRILLYTGNIYIFKIYSKIYYTFFTSSIKKQRE